MKDDFYVSYVDSIITDLDESVILNLYQPLLGTKSVGIFLTLLEENRNYTIKNSTERKHEILLNKLQLTSGEFLTSRHLLEGLGLLSTYLKTSEDGSNHYAYVLHAPKNPKAFLDDPLLKNLLIKYIGIEEVNKIIKRFELKNNLSGYENISTSYEENFHMDSINLGTDITLGTPVLGRNEGQIKNDFDLKEFFKVVKRSGCDSDNLFSDDEISKIVSLAVGNKINEVIMGELVLESLELNKMIGKKVNFDLLTNKCITQSHFSPLGIKRKVEKEENGKISSSSMNAKKLKLFQTFKPEEFITILQDNIPPSMSDKSLINYLRMDQSLEDEVINVIIDYCLNFKEKPCFNKKYVDVVASNLIKSKKHKSSIDALSYFYGKKEAKPSEKVTKSNIINKGDEVKEFKSRFSKEERDALLKELEDNTYGKAKK